jgi:hypothetical protein
MPPSTVSISRPVASTSGTIVETSAPAHNEAYSTGISWAAVIGGAFVSASLSLILLALGTGLGFTAISPLSGAAASISTIGRAAIAWLIFTQIIAAALGGYLAGRLRTKWVDVHTDEVYFRDTAHGLLVWAVGLVVTAAFLGSAATSLAGGTAQRNSSANANDTFSTETDAAVFNSNAYFIDTLFRASNPAAERQAPDRSDASDRASDRSQAELIFAHGLREGQFSGADSTYLAQLVAARTGISPTDADKRVGDTFDEARSNAQKTRKALGHLSLWLFVALLAGAFCASYAGTIGGRQRDHVTV